jgi:hypothetical protein
MSIEVKDNSTLLGGGADITGHLVEYWGDVWTVKSKNCLGDWDVERIEPRSGGNVRIESSIASVILPETHPHFVQLLPTN